MDIIFHDLLPLCVRIAIVSNGPIPAMVEAATEILYTVNMLRSVRFVPVSGVEAICHILIGSSGLFV